MTASLHNISIGGGSGAYSENTECEAGHTLDETPLHIQIHTFLYPRGILVQPIHLLEETGGNLDRYGEKV